MENKELLNALAFPTVPIPGQIQGQFIMHFGLSKIEHATITIAAHLATTGHDPEAIAPVAYELAKTCLTYCSEMGKESNIVPFEQG